MLTLTHQYEKPQNPDTGDIWFPGMERNVQRMNDHTHDPRSGGANDGAQLFVCSQNILAAAWSAAPVGGGHYRQLVTMTSPYQYDTTMVQFRLSSGEQIFPSVERVSANTYYVYTSDNSLAFVAYYR